MPHEPALLTSAAMDGEAQSASSERSPGWAERTSGDGALAAPSRREILMHVENRRYVLTAARVRRSRTARHSSSSGGRSTTIRSS